MKNKSSPKQNLANNLRQLMLLANISEHELSRRTNIKQPIIHRLLSGENTNPKLQTIKPLADYFMLSISQLIGEQELESVWPRFTSKNHLGWKEVPLINYHTSSQLFNKKLAKSISTECNVSKNSFAILVSDKSMEPLFPERSIAIVEPELKPDNGDFIAIKISKDEFIIRTLLYISDEKYINTLNNRADSISKISNRHKILGTVVRTIYDHKLLPEIDQ